MKIMMARALTKSTTTLRGTNRINFAAPIALRAIWDTPARITATTKHPKPCSRLSGPITNATAPVAAEIMALCVPENTSAQVSAARA